MTELRRHITETAIVGKRLGRHVEHDERSKAFPARVADVVTTLHKRHSKILDQGELGSCTGNAMTGLLGTDPHYSAKHTAENPVDNEALAVKLYEHATLLDNVDGAYPPDDTGSTGLAVAKAAQQQGLISGYAHAFGLQHALGALAVAPVIVGVNWYDSFDGPDNHGNVTISADAQVRGGHEFELIGLDAEEQFVHAVNSWGASWGLHGNFYFSFADLDRLLAEDGDCTTVT